MLESYAVVFALLVYAANFIAMHGQYPRTTMVVTAIVAPFCVKDDYRLVVGGLAFMAACVHLPLMTWWLRRRAKVTRGVFDMLERNISNERFLAEKLLAEGAHDRATDALLRMERMAIERDKLEF